MKKSWFEIKALSASAASISIDGEIGGFGVSAQSFNEQLAALGNVTEITLYINSSGGSVQDGIAIYNALQRHPAKITAEIVGWALSMASYIAMAGDVVRMAENALMMIHAPWLQSAGNADELRRSAEMLDKVAESMVSAYAAKSGKSPQEIISLMAAETWFSAAEAQAAGFADEIESPVTVTASFDPSRDRRIPERLRGKALMNTQHDAQARANLERIAEINSNYRKFSGQDGIKDLAARCIADPKCSVEEANKRLLEHIGKDCAPIAGGRFFGDFDSSDNRIRDFKAAAIDTLLMRAGVRVPNASPACRDLQRHSVVAMAESLLSMSGRSTQGMSRADVINASLTTSDFPQLLANTAGKALRLGYENDPGTHVVWTAERDVADFKPQTLVSLSEAPGFLEVPEGAEYKAGAFSEAAETFAVKSYGRVLEISRQAIINDDLSAFTQMPAAFGSSARRLEADLVYGRLTGSQVMSDNKALFHTAHGNLAASGAAISLDTLGAARAAMRKQKGVAGLGYIDPQPRFIIVPVCLETKAEQILSSIVVPAVQSNAMVEWMRNLQIVADPRLDAVSETAWYLAASPTQIDTIVRAYLAGEPRPYYEENVAFERDVMGIKSRLDFGVGVIDWRGLFKNPGA